MNFDQQSQILQRLQQAEQAIAQSRPVKPNSAFDLFAASLQKQYGFTQNSPNYQKVLTLVTQAWEVLPPHERLPFEQHAQQEFQRYREDERVHEQMQVQYAQLRQLAQSTGILSASGQIVQQQQQRAPPNVQQYGFGGQAPERISSQQQQYSYQQQGYGQAGPSQASGAAQYSQQYGGSYQQYSRPQIPQGLHEMQRQQQMRMHQVHNSLGIHNNNPLQQQQRQPQSAFGGQPPPVQPQNIQSLGPPPGAPQYKLPPGMPSSIHVVCLGVPGVMFLGDQRIVCECSSCRRLPADQRIYSCHQFEVHSGAGNQKRWKESIRVRAGAAHDVPQRGDGIPIGQWLTGRGVDVQNFKPLYKASSGAIPVSKDSKMRPALDKAWAQGRAVRPDQVAPARQRSQSYDDDELRRPMKRRDTGERRQNTVVAQQQQGGAQQAAAVSGYKFHSNTPWKEVLDRNFRPINVRWSGERCCVCDQDGDTDDDQIITCDRCGIAVHQSCYGVSKVPGVEEMWLCRACELKEDGKPAPQCCLCPVAGGALKPANLGGLWCHSACVQWVPEVAVEDPETMEPITGIRSIQKERWDLQCTVCKSRMGAKIQCESCFTAYHPLCARIAGYKMEMLETGDDGDDVELISYCARHRKPEPNASGVRKVEESEDGGDLPQLTAEATKLYNGQPYPMAPAVCTPQNSEGCVRGQPLVDWVRASHGTGTGSTTAAGFWIPSSTVPRKPSNSNGILTTGHSDPSHPGALKSPAAEKLKTEQEHTKPLPPPRPMKPTGPPTPTDLIPLPPGVPERIAISCNRQMAVFIVRSQVIQYQGKEIAASKFELLCGYKESDLEDRWKSIMNYVSPMGGKGQKLEEWLNDKGLDDGVLHKLALNAMEYTAWMEYKQSAQFKQDQQQKQEEVVDLTADDADAKKPDTVVKAEEEPVAMTVDTQNEKEDETAQKPAASDGNVAVKKTENDDVDVHEVQKEEKDEPQQPVAMQVDEENKTDVPPPPANVVAPDTANNDANDDPKLAHAIEQVLQVIDDSIGTDTVYSDAPPAPTAAAPDDKEKQPAPQQTAQASAEVPEPVKPQTATEPTTAPLPAGPRLPPRTMMMPTGSRRDPRQLAGIKRPTPPPQPQQEVKQEQQHDSKPETRQQERPSSGATTTNDDITDNEELIGAEPLEPPAGRLASKAEGSRPPPKMRRLDALQAEIHPIPNLGGVPGSDVVGGWCRVWWPEDEEWYLGRVDEYSEVRGQFKVWYELDRQAEWIDLAKEDRNGRLQVIQKDVERKDWPKALPMPASHVKSVSRREHVQQGERYVDERSEVKGPAKGQDAVGRKVRVFWAGDETFKTGMVRSWRSETNEHFVVYDDGHAEWTDLSVSQVEWPATFSVALDPKIGTLGNGYGLKALPPGLPQTLNVVLNDLCGVLDLLEGTITVQNKDINTKDTNTEDDEDEDKQKQQGTSVITPVEFEKLGGRAASKKWKSTIKIDTGDGEPGISLETWLIENQIDAPRPSRGRARRLSNDGNNNNAIVEGKRRAAVRRITPGGNRDNGNIIDRGRGTVSHKENCPCIICKQGRRSARTQQQAVARKQQGGASADNAARSLAAVAAATTKGGAGGHQIGSTVRSAKVSYGVRTGKRAFVEALPQLITAGGRVHKPHALPLSRCWTPEDWASHRARQLQIKDLKAAGETGPLSVTGPVVVATNALAVVPNNLSARVSLGYGAAGAGRMLTVRERLELCAATEHERVTFGKSGIHGWGLFARAPMRQDSMVAEFRGEMVRRVVADVREVRYQAEGRDCYIFNLDDTVVIDATKKGTIARFTNHSCQPSMYTKIFNVDGDLRLAFFARVDIKPGQELTYNYRFTAEEGEERIPCTCGAPGCKRYLN